MPVGVMLEQMTVTELEGWWRYFEEKEKLSKHGKD